MRNDNADLGWLWLRARNAVSDGRIDLPLLMIDDEADNASINTRKNPDETTAINQAIRDLLSLFRRSSYVGFTATPFANIFIDPSSTDEMLGDDLFPRDFIHVLAPPDNYVGMNALFPPRDQDDETNSAPGDVQPDEIIRTIPDSEDWLPGGHKKDAEPGPLPDSLRNTEIPADPALDDLLVAPSDARAADKEERDKQRVSDGLLAVTTVVALGAATWRAIRSFAEEKQLLTAEDGAALTIGGAIPRRVPTDRQATRLLLIKQRCEEAGYELPTAGSLVDATL